VQKFGALPVTSELKRVEFEIFAAIRPQFDHRLLFGILTLRNEFEHRNFDCSALIGKHFCPSCTNLVRFGSVIPKLKSKDVGSCTADVQGLHTLATLDKVAALLGTTAISNRA